mmetsp:Transcript_65977/g.141191  ORF Transcript_65977/g.141191 Transcript_65977/m.141191 type:complete len:492 (+) Transcript_65977:1-1476(+)
MAHVECALEVQAQLLPAHGFEGSTSGVSQMRQETSVFVNLGDHVIAKVMKDIHRLLDYGEPMPKMPLIEPYEAPRFPVEEKDKWLEHLADHGFAVVAGVAKESEVKRAYDLLWEFIENSDAGGMVNRADVRTWAHSTEEGKKNFLGWPAGKEDGIIHSRGIGQSKALWYLRGLPALKQAFSDIWGTKHLVTSFDGAGVFRPYGHNASWRTTKVNWHHVDQAHRKRGLHCVQGLLTLKDATACTGGLVVVPGSHRFHSDILRNYRKRADGWNFLSVDANDMVLTEGSTKPVMVCAKAGDLLLWDSRTIHCNTLPLKEDRGLLHGQDLIRAVAYICMTPAAWCSEETVLQRSAAFKRGVTTSHWPHEFHAMSVCNVDANFTLGKEQLMLACPQKADGWTSALASLAPKEGGISFLPSRRYRARAETTVRRIPTTEWDKPIATLPKDSEVEGYAFGGWLRMTTFPQTPDLMAHSREEHAEMWVPLDRERLKRLS